MPGKIDPSLPFHAVRIAVMTVSDTRNLEDDTSGDVLVKRLEEAGHVLADRAIVKDDKAAIVDRLKTWIADNEIDVVISTGGTGLTGRDVTPEAFHSVYEKQIDGFSILFHNLSYEKNRHFYGAIPCHGGGGRRYLFVCFARIPRRVQRWLGWNPQIPAGFPLSAV